MRTLLLLFGCVVLLTGCQSEKAAVISGQQMDPVPAEPVISKSQEGAFEVTTATRTNGCTLVLRRYTKNRPAMQGYWVQDAFVSGRQLFRIQHSTSPKEQALMFNRMTDIMVMPIDRNLDGRYDLFLLLSPKTQKLVDALVLTDDGWLRHASQEEYEARRKIAEGNKQAAVEADKIFQSAIHDAAEDLNK